MEVSAMLTGMLAEVEGDMVPWTSMMAHRIYASLPEERSTARWMDGVYRASSSENG